MIVKLLLPNAIISVGAALLIPYMNVFFRERHHVPDETLGVIFALSSVVTGVATLAAPLLARRFGKVRSVALAQAAFAAVLVDHWLCAIVSVGGNGVLGARRFDEHGRAALQCFHDGTGCRRVSGLRSMPLPA